MNVRELIEALEELADAHGDETEVRFAHQPAWPFEYAISQVIASGPDQQELYELNAMLEDPANTAERADIQQRIDEVHAEPSVIYLAEGSQLGYLPGAVCTELGWGR